MVIEGNSQVAQFYFKICLKNAHSDIHVFGVEKFRKSPFSRLLDHHGNSTSRVEDIASLVLVRYESNEFNF